MRMFKYVIVGGGMTGDAAAKGIREVDSEGTIAMFTVENHRPYDRPPLTKGLWKGDDANAIWHEPTQDVDLMLGRRIERIDREARQVQDDRGETYGFEKLLLATGVSPRHLKFGEGVVYFRTYDDYEKLKDEATPGRRIAVIGGGFIGSELSASLVGQGCHVTLIFPSSGIGTNIFPPGLSENLVDYYREKGVDVKVGSEVHDVRREGSGYRIRVQDGSGNQADEKVDLVVAGVGTVPNVSLAKNSGLTVEYGVEVDEFLATSDPNIYAAGDVANFYDPATEKRRRVEHEDNANSMGKAAGRNMAGVQEKFHHQPFFYSDLFDLGYEAVGEVDSRLEFFEDWKDPFREGVVYYLRDGRVRGVLLWKVWDQVDAARELIAAKELVNPENLRGRLPKK